MAQNTGAIDMGTATDFNGNLGSIIGWSFEVLADSIHRYAIWVTITEGAMGVEGIKSIIFVIFGVDDW